MNFKQLEAWVEANPGKSIIIGGAGVLFLLWIFGAFSRPKAADGGQSLAAAYYAAEAQQAVVGGQIQMANIASTADVAKTKITADTAATINQQQGAVVSHLGDLSLSATLSNNQTLLAGLQDTNATRLSAINAAVNGTEAVAMIQSVIPAELKMTGGFGNFFLPNGQRLSVNTGSPVGNPNTYQGMGFSADQANALALADFTRANPDLANNPNLSTSRNILENLMGTLQFPG